MAIRDDLAAKKNDRGILTVLINAKTRLSYSIHTASLG